jgi:uncharacterized protein (DUF2249 family)
MVDLSHRILGSAPSPSADATGLPAALQGLQAVDIVDLDVREDLRQGREPFSRIMAARKSLPPGAVLRLRATIEPVPLYGVMERQGLTHWTEQLGPEDWRIWFHPPAGQAARGSCGTTMPRSAPEPVVLDVRDLEPPEPMVRTLQALEDLPRDGTLIQLNVRVPRFLLPQLEERGFSYEVHEESPERVRLVIRHRDSDEPAEGTSGSAGRELDVRVLPPREKHPAIFARFDSLEPGDSFVLVNDHDPVPLRYQFAAERPGGFTWNYLEQGPDIWRVRIARA